MPDQANIDTQIPTGLMTAARFTGVSRIAASLGDGLDGTVYSDRIRQQMTVFANRNSLSPTYVDEMEHIALHEEQAASVDDGELILVPGEHYLHHTHSLEIAEQTLAFLSGKPARSGE